MGVRPLGSTKYANTDAYPGKNRSYYIGDVARHLLSITDEYVNIRVVYANHEFHAVDVIQTLEDRDLNYIIPAVKHVRVGPLCKRLGQLKPGTMNRTILSCT